MRVYSMLLMGAAAVVLAMALSTAPGCGPGTPDVDKSALYTPESLADELAFRYRALKPEARKSTRGAESGSKAARTAAALDRARQAEKKTGDAEPAKKRTGPPTLDDLLADIDAKIGKIPKTPRPEVCRKMIEALSRDAALSEEDRKILSDRLGEMGSS